MQVCLNIHSVSSFVFQVKAGLLKQERIATKDSVIQRHHGTSFDYFWLCLKKRSLSLHPSFELNLLQRS